MFVQTNILIGYGGRVRIAGLATASIPSAMPGVGVDRFFHGAAPELIDPQRFGFIRAESTMASDVYAFGIVAWEVSSAHANSFRRNPKRN